jgi:hemerythrin-like metal-binding protein
MIVLKWDDKYSVGVTEMDNQHKRLIELISQFYEEGVKQKKPNEALQHVLDGLLEYTKFHFTSEEQLMKDNGYDGFDDQVKQHQVFIEKIEGFVKRFQEERLITPIEIINFLSDWLIKHIQGEDSKYGPHLNSKGIN